MELAERRVGESQFESGGGEGRGGTRHGTRCRTWRGAQCRNSQAERAPNEERKTKNPAEEEGLICTLSRVWTKQALKQLLLVARRDALRSLLQHCWRTHIARLLLSLTFSPIRYKSVVVLLIDVIQRRTLEHNDLMFCFFRNVAVLFLHFLAQQFANRHLNRSFSHVVVNIHCSPLSLLQ